MNRFPKVKKYYTLNTERELEIVDNNIVDKLNELISSLDNNKEVYLTTRGDNRGNLEIHNEFFTSEYIKSFFGVGLKSKSAIKIPRNEEFEHTIIEEKTQVVSELKKVIEYCNERIDKKPESHNIQGRVSDSFIESLDNYSVEELNKWKIFFLSFLHNDGSLNEFKSSSPFLSLTQGWKKYRTARNFSLWRNKYGRGIIYLYALSKHDNNYFVTKEFTKKLKEFDIVWYEDNHKEIMLLNGMFPHYLLGIFEVTKTSTPKFILNPELYKLLENSEEFDFRGGLSINQDNFLEMAQKLGYKRFFYTYGNGSTFITDINGDNIGETISIV